MSPTNYVSYQDPETGNLRIGHYDLDNRIIQPLSFSSGTPISTLYQVIEAGVLNIRITGDPLPISSTKVLPPITGRDILCVGKNYLEHAREFNSSGFDSSDKVDRPSHPVIFTKRFTSIIADGEEIYPHPEFTQTLDYEGEIGVIVGRPGWRISEEEAWGHVWGFTIINDVTARERQRDHKQFYIGKSGDGFCPMGPIAVPLSKLRLPLRVQTHVNNELRQNATTDDLIFSIPNLLKTMSEGQTLMVGDVLATGTPAGVGFGQTPPTYLQPGDTVSISITGLGTLTNRIADPTAPNTTLQKVQPAHLHSSNTSRTPNLSQLTTINHKPLHYKAFGPETAPPIVFIHGLGGSSESFAPLISTLNLAKTHRIHLFDFEGHGLSPTHPLSTVSTSSLAYDLNGVFDHANIASGATVIAHSMGCLIALKHALTYPDKVSKLVLLGPPLPPSRFPEEAGKALRARMHTVRTQGMSAAVDGIVNAATSEKTKMERPVALAAIRMSLLGQDPEGYAKACTALADASGELDISKIKAQVLIVTGKEDRVSTPETCKEYVYAMGGNAGLEVLEGVGHWHVFEDVGGVGDAIGGFLGQVL